jgi:hypothetical protein
MSSEGSFHTIENRIILKGALLSHLPIIELEDMPNSTYGMSKKLTLPYHV